MPFEFSAALQPGGGGGGVTGANNGLRLQGTEVYLGGTLLENTIVESAGFLLILGDFANAANGTFISIRDVSQSVTLVADAITNIEDTLGNQYLSVDITNNSYAFGDIDGVTNGMAVEVLNSGSVVRMGELGAAGGNASVFQVDDANKLLNYNTGGFNYLSFDATNGLFQMGDLDSAGNLCRIAINDGLDRIESFTNDYRIYQTLGGNKLMLALDGTNNYYQMGDINAAANSTFLTIDDFQKIFSVQVGINYMMLLDQANGLYQIGDVNAAGNSTNISIDDTAETITLQQGAGILLLADFSGASNTVQLGDANNCVFVDVFNETIDFKLTDGSSWLQATNGQVIIGDTQSVGNDTFIDVTDSNQQVRVRATNGLRITGNAAFLLHTGTTLTNNAGAGAGTLTNAPTAGDPAKWIAINDNGTTRYIPTWI